MVKIIQSPFHSFLKTPKKSAALRHLLFHQKFLDDYSSQRGRESLRFPSETIDQYSINTHIASIDT